VTGRIALLDTKQMNYFGGKERKQIDRDADCYELSSKNSGMLGEFHGVGHVEAGTRAAALSCSPLLDPSV